MFEEVGNTALKRNNFRSKVRKIVSYKPNFVLTQFWFSLIKNLQLAVTLYGFVKIWLNLFLKRTTFPDPVKMLKVWCNA
jgi:hypothetical protein